MNTPVSFVFNCSSSKKYFKEHLGHSIFTDVHTIPLGWISRCGIVRSEGTCISHTVAMHQYVSLWKGHQLQGMNENVISLSFLWNWILLTFFFWNKIEKYKWHPIFFFFCSFDLSITIEVKFSPTYLLAIWISSLIICRLMFSAHLSIRLVIFFLLTCKNFFFPYKLVQFVAIFWTVWFPPFIYFNSV